MPVLVQWKWQESTKTFVAIFHFYDDGRKPNLRLKKRRFVGGSELSYIKWLILPTQPLSRKNQCALDKRRDENEFTAEFQKAVVTWSPTHPESALVSELLSYANIINGLKEWRKRELIPKLIATTPGKEYLELDDVSDKLFDSKQKAFLIGYEKPDYWLFCYELCPEYIDYLKRTLKPYLRA